MRNDEWWRNPIALRALRGAMGAVTLVAVLVQLVAASHKPEFRLENFFGYFTILSNTFAALVLIYIATTDAKSAQWLDVVRGAATLCLTMVGVIFSLLLAHLESDVLIWVNVVVHYLMPVAIVADWVIDPPHTPITVREMASWLAIPAVYVGSTLIRGSIVHWYPYPFLNVDTNGWATVAAYVAIILVFTLVIAISVSAIGNARRHQRDRSFDANLM